MIRDGPEEELRWSMHKGTRAFVDI